MGGWGGEEHHRPTPPQSRQVGPALALSHLPLHHQGQLCCSNKNLVTIKSLAGSDCKHLPLVTLLNPQQLVVLSEPHLTNEKPRLREVNHLHGVKIV